MNERTANGVVIIPKWFLGVASFILLAAVPWAGKQSIDTASTKVEMKYQSLQIDTMKEEIIRRVDRNETRIDKLHELHRTGDAK